MEECLLHIDTKTNTISVNNGFLQPEPIPVRREYKAERFRREYLVEVIKEKITEEEFDAFIEWVQDNY